MRIQIPLLSSLRRYDRATFQGDLTAGLTTAVMLIPQGMGYAMLAGLPPIYGLYSSLLPLMVYAIFGSSRQLAVGPVAMVSLLVATGVGALAEPGTDAFVLYATLLALMVGVMQTLMGVARLGFLVNFMSHPVISGFTSAAALIIGFSQLKHLLGFEIPRSHHVHRIVLSALDHADQTHLVTVLIGTLGIIALMAMKRFVPRWPRALIVVGAASGTVWLGDLDQAGVRIVGSVPEGLPHITLPTVELSAMATLWPIALTIALVGFMESIAVAKKYAQMNRYEVQADQELLGLGLANLAGAITQGYPVTGGFSRTAVNAQAGAKSGVAALITALVIGLTLLFFTPLFYYLPKAILASIIMTAVFGLVDLHEVKHLWVVKRSDLAMLAITFVATLTLGIERGILLGVVASLLLIVYHSTRPHVAVLGRLPGSDVYRNINRFPEAEQLPGVLALRLDSQFYFGNVNFLKDTLESLESERAGGVDVVVLDASGINQIDASAETALREITEAYRRRCVRFILTDLKGPVRDVLERSSYYDVIGRENVFQRVEDAMAALAKNSIGPSLAPSLRDSKTNEEVSC